MQPVRDIDARLARARWPELLAFALALGVFGTLFSQYRYGFVNHVEQLPPIMRALDPGVMPGDRTVDELCTFGPRHYYVALIAGLARIAPLPVVFLVLTLLAHSGTALVTVLAGRRLFRSTITGMLAAALVVSVASIGIGGAAHLVRSQLVPQTLATPLLLMALLAGWTARPFIAALCAAVASLIHPLAGAHTGMIALGLCAAAVLLGWVPESAGAVRERLRRLWPVAGAGALFAIAVYVLWIAPDGRHSYDLVFLQDFAVFRSPHHHLPSHFSPGACAAFACFTLAIVAAWVGWHRDPAGDRLAANCVGLCLVAVYVAFFCGYVFVELVPTRLFLMAQTFRLAFIVKWLGMLLIAASAVRMMARDDRRRCALGAFVTLAGTGPFQPAFVLFGQVIDAVQRRAGRFAFPMLLASSVGAGAAGVVLWRTECLNEVLALAVSGTLVAWYLRAGAVWRSGGALAAVALCVITVSAGRGSDGAALLGEYQPVFTLDDGADSRDGLAIFVREHTPRDAVFLTPPYFGRFRILAQRGLVVDFKCMPYDAAGYVGWRQRLRDCYGEVQAAAEKAVVVMKNHYRWITPASVLDVADKYGADYAVLYRKTPNDWPVVYQDDRFKLVAIPRTGTSITNVASAAPTEPRP